MKLLLTGATGYVGGSILTTLLRSQNPLVREMSITVLVRQQSQADILASHGVAPLLFSGLDDAELLRRVAAEHDVVVHAASGFHTCSAEALIAGLDERRARIDSEVHFIQTYGMWNLAEGALLVTDAPARVFSDAEDDIVALEEQLESVTSFPQRATDVAVISAAEKAGVRSYIVMPPDVYGAGTGLFNTQSAHIPDLARDAVNHGEAAYVGDCLGEVGHVHFGDLAALYELLLGKILVGGECAVGREGFYFCAAGAHLWREVAEIIGAAAARMGLLRSAVPRSIEVGEAAGR